MFILVFFNAFSQYQLKGKIEDNKNGDLLIGASILVVETGSGITTNANGNFNILLSPGSYTLKLSYLGYQPREERITITNKNITRDFYLQPSSENIEEIIVEGKGKVQQIREEPFQVNALDAKPLQVQSKPVTALVGQISGVRVRENGGMGSNVNIMLNGIGGKGIRIFVDGIPADLLGNGMAINNLPVNMIDRVEVYKGMIPAKFGSDALGGIINLVTRDIKQDYIDASVGVGSFNTYQVGLNSRKILGENKNIYTGFSGFYNHSDNNYWMDDVEIRSDTKNNTETGSVRRFNDAYTSCLGRFTSGIKSLSWSDDLQLNISASYLYKELQHGKSAEQAWGEAFYKENNLNAELRWKKQHMLHDNLDAFINAGYNYIERTFIDTASRTYYWGAVEGIDPYVTSEPGESGFYSNGRNPVIDRNNIFARINLVYRLIENQELNFTYTYSGIEITGQDERGADTYGYDIYKNPQSLYKQYLGFALESDFWDGRLKNILVGKSFFGNSDVVVIDASYLAEGNIQNSYQIYGYGEALKLQLFSNLALTLNYEHTIRLPDEEEIFGDFITIYPNAELEPEESQNIGVGIRYHSIGGKIATNINGFYRDTYNKIFLNALSVFTSTYMNVLSTETIGAEGEITYKPIRGLSFNANLTWQDIRISDVDPNGDLKEKYIGYRLPNTPFLFGNGGVVYQLPWNLGKQTKINVYYTYNYVHSFLLSWDVGIDNDDIPTQSIHNAGISYTFYKDKLSLNLESRNISDERVYDNYKVQKPGRSFYLKLRLFLE